MSIGHSGLRRHLHLLPIEDEKFLTQQETHFLSNSVVGGKIF